MKLKKMMDIRNGRKNYFLGLNKNGDKMWLVAPSWDCGWYWGLGYIETYQQNWSPSKARDILCHTHFDCVFPSYDIFINKFNDTPFTRNEKWKIYEYMKELCMLQHYADMMHQNGMNITEGSNTLKEEKEYNIKEYNRIKILLIPNVWEELEAILI
jgi:hypothetical protein